MTVSFGNRITHDMFKYHKVEKRFTTRPIVCSESVCTLVSYVDNRYERNYPRCIGWTAICAFLLFKWRSWNNTKNNGPVENIKNALLAYALHKVCDKNEFDSGPLADYSKFDGSILPSMSGSNLTQACFTYIQNKNVRRQSPFYTKAMENKACAIEKFLAKRLSTDKEAYDFFDAMVKSCSSIPPTDVTVKTHEKNS